jgi:poly(hydroxyalkanoate) depolymerase family esterase
MKPRALPDLLSGIAPLKEATQAIQRALSPAGGAVPALGKVLRRVLEPSARPAQAPAAGGTFLARSFTNEAGTRPYKLYVPGGYAGRPVPLIVMLHGCTQSPDDFAAGTRMNALAEARTFLVAYPGQTRAANMQKCWNWFQPDDQARDGGEPALIAGITREVMAGYAVDPARVYAAGLSAGGAAAAIMGQTYPDLFAAIGVHSGLACGAARDMSSAMAAMRAGSAGRDAAAAHIIPTIIFHGSADHTVNARNAGQVAAQAAAGGALAATEEAGQSTGGHAYTRTLYAGPDGVAVIEQWLVQGGGHAWFGGSALGSYTDPMGPDASAEMLRFFAAHARR